MEEVLNKEITLKNASALTIRKVTPADAGNIVAYMDHVGGESDNLTFGPGELNMTVLKETEFIENIHKDGRSLMLAGLIAGEIASVATLKCHERKRVRHNAYFSITVRQKYWGIGVGNAMLTELIGHAKACGDIRNITLGVRAGNDRAISLYEKHGFVKIGVQKYYFYFGGNYHDSILMDLYL